MKNFILFLGLATLLSCSQTKKVEETTSLDCEIIKTLLSNDKIPIIKNFHELYQMDSLEDFLLSNYDYDTFTYSYLARIPFNLNNGKIENGPGSTPVDVRIHTALKHPEYAYKMTPTPFNIFVNQTKTRLGTKFIPKDSLGFWLRTYYTLPDSSMQLNNMYTGMSLSWDRNMNFSRFEETLGLCINSFVETMNAHSLYRFDSPICAVERPNYLDYMKKKYFFVLYLELDLCVKKSDQ